MTADQWIKLLEAVAKLLGSVAWPIVALVVLLRFVPFILRALPGVDQFDFDAPGFKGSVQMKKATAALVDAAKHSPASNQSPRDAASSATRVVKESVTSRVLERAPKARILWVDDRPGNNIHERQAFEALGIQIDLALSTDDGLERAAERHYDVIVSDMGRPPILKPVTRY